MENIAATQGWLEALFPLWCLSLLGASLVYLSLWYGRWEEEEAED